jgi:hypothetical protein
MDVTSISKKAMKTLKGWGRPSNVDTGRLSGLKYKLICCFKLVADMNGGSIWEFVNDMDTPAFLERELMGLGVNGYQ